MFTWRSSSRQKRPTSLKIGAEARITVDHAPGRAAAGYVSFVSPEAQFTPKQVETRSERDKLMFRVKIQVPEELVTSYIERIKTGVRGVGYVKVDESAVWPAWLQNLVAPPKKPERHANREPASPAVGTETTCRMVVPPRQQCIAKDSSAKPTRCGNREPVNAQVTPEI